MTKSNREAAIILAIATVAFALRLAAGWFLRSDDFWGSGYSFFVDLANSIAAGKGIAIDDAAPTAFRVPAYPLLLAALTWGHRTVLPVMLAQSALGAGTVISSGILARDIFGRSAGITAAAITALYPYYVLHDTALQETSLFTLLSIASVILIVRTRRTGTIASAGATGALLAALVLTRANLAPFAVLAPLCLACPGQSEALFASRRLRAAIVCALVALLAASPWIARSYALTGSPTLTTQTGFFLWLGNNPYTFSHYPQDSIDRSQEIASAALTQSDLSQIAAFGNNEALVDHWYWQKGLNYILEHPGQSFVNGLYKIAAAFSWLPSPRHGGWSDIGMAATFGPVMLLGLIGMWISRGQWRDQLVIYAQFIAFAAVTAVFFGHTSYRVYLDVFWIVFAAGMLQRLARSLRFVDTAPTMPGIPT